jgi:hypothetical protein
LPADDQWDEIAVQDLRCSSMGCGFRGIAVYEESRRGALDSECVVHTGYGMSSSNIVPDMKAVAELIQCKDKAGFAQITEKSFPMVFSE